MLKLINIKNKTSNLFLIILFSCLFISNSGFAQDNYAREMLEKAKTHMKNDNYSAANDVFREMLDDVDVLPTEMSYYFALTLFHLKQYENSRNFIEKYLNLTDHGDDHHEQAIKLKEKLKPKNLEIKECDYCNLQGYRLITCNKCDGKGETTQVCTLCGGNGKTACPRCHSDGIVEYAGPLGNALFKKCPECNGKGVTECARCHGNKKVHSTCPRCLGSGKEATDEICDHEPIPFNSH